MIMKCTNRNTRLRAVFRVSPLPNLAVRFLSIVLIIDYCLQHLTEIPCRSLNVNDTEFAMAANYAVALGPCALEVARNQSVKGLAPLCTSDGYYERRQYDTETGGTWCVTTKGVELEGTRTEEGEKRVSCNGKCK